MISLDSDNHSSDLSPQPLELWGGIECTIARIHDNFRNQIEETGHSERMTDLDAIAALGVKTLRYPILWETISPDNPEQADWRWHDSRLNRLHELGIAPLAGLVHHGSGPRYTNLLDPSFPELLARHARRVAERYPWITLYTPVNEPLTTARFSGLYGHWYPHGRDTHIMLRCLYTQCRAVALSMQAIRAITPNARLVQTEDLGKTFSFPDLQYQADYENERRWLSLDLLCGRIGPAHAWYSTFLEAGITEEDLRFFIEHPCIPDIVGINHYVTSERFLDRRSRDYPTVFRTDAAPYVDVHATRVPHVEGLTGPEARLREAWERYKLPMAVTEAHLGGSRDDQLRWLNQIWRSATKLRKEGADIRAVTIWSMFGCVDWNSLLTQRNGFYESGVFDARTAPARPTALASAAAALAKQGHFDHPVLDGIGWWHRPDRFFMPVTQCTDTPLFISSARKLVITGGRGTLGRAFSRICTARSLDHVLLTRDDMDIANEISVEAALVRCKPWAVINAAGYVRVADASREPERCMRENVTGAEVLARACAKLGIPYVTFSSDLVFDGQLGRAYIESDQVSPVCTYGISKADAERKVQAAFPDALVVRTSAFFGPWDRYNFIHLTLRDLAMGRPVEANDSIHVSPTYVPDLVHATLDLLIDRASGIWHLANRGAVSWYELAARAAREARMETTSLTRVEGGGRTITALSSERGLLLPTLSNALERYFQENTMPWNSNQSEYEAI